MRSSPGSTTWFPDGETPAPGTPERRSFFSSAASGGGAAPCSAGKVQRNLRRFICIYLIPYATARPVCPRRDAVCRDRHTAPRGGQRLRCACFGRWRDHRRDLLAEAKKAFAVDPNKLGYTVVEIAVYPDRDIEVASKRLRPRHRQGRPPRPAHLSCRDRRPVPGQDPEDPRTRSGSRRRRSGIRVRPVRSRRLHRGWSRCRRRRAFGPRAASQSARTGHRRLRKRSAPGGPLPQARRWLSVFQSDAAEKSVLELTWYGADGLVRLAMPPTK